MKELVKNEKGQALIIVLALLAIGGLTIATALNHMTTGLKAGQLHERKMVEFYSADAGVELALWNLKKHELEVLEGDQSALPQFTMNAKAVDVTVGNIGGQTYKITSTAASDDGSSTTIEAHVTAFAVHAIMSTSTDPEDYSVVRNQAIINGDVYYSGSYSILDDAIINGSIVYDPAPVDLGIDPEEYKTEAQSGGTHEGDLTIDSSPYTLGPLYITGKLTIDENMEVVLGGTVYVEKEIVIEKNVTINGTGNLVAASEKGRAINIKDNFTIDCDNIPLIMAAYSSGELKVNHYCNITGLLYSPFGKVHVHAKGPSSIYGALIGAAVRVCEDTVVTFNPEISGLAPYEWHIQGWQTN